VDQTCPTEQVSLAVCGVTTIPTGTPDGGHPTTGMDATTGSACAELATCCPNVSASAQGVCTSIAAGGNATGCAKALSDYTAAGECSTVTGTGTGSGSMGSGTGNPGTGSGTGNPGTGSGTGHPGTGSGTGTGHDAGQPSGCAPHALPAGWTGVDHPPGGTSSCTSAQLTSLVSDCFTSSDAGTACETDEESTCGECTFTANTSTDWGPILTFDLVGSTTALQGEYPFISVGGCIQGVDPSAGFACAEALDTVIECELASCLAYCPVTSDTDVTGYDALIGTFDPSTNELTTPGCIENADTSTCATYVSASNTACASEFNDAGTDNGGKCENGPSDWTTFIAAYCGGAVSGL
jgi:hypothetical protein